jgi:hypothetical protein
MKIKMMILVVLAVGLLAVSCKKTEEAATGTEPTATAVTTSEIAGTTSPNDLNPVQAQSFVDDVTIGHEVAADGTIPAGKTGDDFAPGEAVHIVMKVKDAPAASAVKVVFNNSSNTSVGEETNDVPAGALFLAFSKDTKDWPKGDYTADVWIGDEKVNTQHFQVVDAAGAGK